MTRRRILQSAIAFAGCRLDAQSRADAQPVNYHEYSLCLPDYLSGLAEQAYARRNARISDLKSAGAIREYQAWCRRTFLQLIGGLPERTPLNLRTVGAFDRSRYRVEKLVYESRPGLFVTANLYLPKSGSPPFPGVLFQMGHSANGKSYALYQRCCQGLVQLGYVVLAFDPMGQGERTYYPAPGGWLTRLRAPTEEHVVPGRQMLLVGETATQMQLWDAIRSLDVLAAHPQVDAKRLASTGQSGGGTLTMVLAGADERLAAAAVCSGNTENFAARPFIAPGSADDAEQDILGSGPLAFDRWDMLWPLAPKPLLIAISAHDFFDTYSPSYQSNGREEFAKLSRAYSTLGAASRLQFYECPLPHGLSYPLRMAVYNWFEKHLKPGSSDISEEPPTAPEDDHTLWCGATGNTVRDFRSKSPFVLLSEHARSIQTPDAAPDLRALLGMDPPAPPPRLSIAGRTKYANCDILALEINSAPKVWLPAWLFLPKQASGEALTRMLIVLEPNGRNGQWREDGLYPQLASSGMAVCAADVRGVGDLQPAYSPGAASYARERQYEETYAWASMVLGHSLLGQRVTDIVALTEALARQYPQSSIVIAARDKMTVPALCAAVLDRRITKLYLERHLVSWRKLVESENYSYTLANFAFNVLPATDLPQLARSIAPRPVIVAGTVDASGQLISGAPVWDFSTLRNL